MQFLKTQQLKKISKSYEQEIHKIKTVNCLK